MLEVFKIQYIHKENRYKTVPYIPEWQKKVNKINLEYSRLQDIILDNFPAASEVMLNACMDLGDPNDYCKIEVFETFNIRYNNHDTSFFYIDTETLEVFDPNPASWTLHKEDVEPFTGCLETEWEDKYGHDMENALYV